jgi:hypothetical protein
MKSLLLAAALLALTAAPAFAKNDVPEPGGIGAIAVAIAALLVARAIRR